MRKFARLALAVALLAPAGIVATNSAGAAGGGFDCEKTVAEGNFSANPGLLLGTAASQTFKLNQRLSCDGGFVTTGTLKATLYAGGTTCGGFTGAKTSTAGTATWSAPLGMGVSTVNLKLSGVNRTVPGQTTMAISGTVGTGTSVIGAGKALTGSITVNKGLKSVANGGHCTINIPLTFGGIGEITALTLKTV